MATYIVGDIQGCLEPLKCLLDQVNFDTSCDRLWSVGDLINRGPESLETLRFLKSMGDNFTTVLGNHDLHLLAVYHGCRKPNSKDTLTEIIEAPDAEDLCLWLQQQPLLFAEGDAVLVHAGVPAIWSIEKALALATEVSDVLKGPHYLNYFNSMYGNLPDTWSDDLEQETRWRVITNYLTRMRYCETDGRLDLVEKGALEDAPRHLTPWFSFPRQDSTHKIFFGHWASLQCQSFSDNIVPLDSGCVWGGTLTFYYLEGNRVIHCNC